MQNYFCKTKNRSILGSSGRVRLGLSSTTAGSSQTRWPIRILEKTAAIPAPRRFSQGTGTNVAAAHPVAQLISRISLPTFRCNTRTTHASPRTHTFHTTYDPNGNLTSKTDARNITTAYTYDALNRMTFRNYSETTPDVTYTYDDPLIVNSKGKLTKVSSSISETKYSSFDILGRVLSSQQITDGQTYSSAYTYNLSGALIEQTYPSGRVVKNVLDNNGDLSIVQSKKTANHGYWNYAKNFSHAASGAVTSLQLGNGRWESTQFNSRLQPTQIALGSVQNGTDKLDLDFGYGATANNGNVLSQTITVPTVGTNQGFTATQTYTYDSLNRLKDAREIIGTTETWKQTFLYDRYGNRNFDTTNNNTTTLLPGCPVNVCNPAANQTNNRLIGYAFDNSGNTTTDAENRTFTYNAENKQIQVNDANGVVGQYFYDGDGKRVKKIVPNGETVIFVYDAAGKLVAEYANQISQTPKVSYLTNDHLGSPRINTDETGAVIARHDYHPFGEEIIGIGGRTTGLGYAADDLRKQFTGYERDNETQLDFAQSRYFNSGFGRFSSPDSFTNDTTKTNPQSWNLYAYVRNNPTNVSDPTGKKGEVSWYTDKDGVVHIKLKASFAIYGAAGQGVSKEHLKTYKKALEKGIKTLLTREGALGNGQKFSMTTDISAKVFSSEEKAIASDRDNIVELGYDQLETKGGTAEGTAFGVKGEDFDRAVVSVSKDPWDIPLISSNFENTMNTMAHEFGAHLLSGLHNTNAGERASLFSVDGGNGAVFQSDVKRLVYGYDDSSYLEPPPNPGEKYVPKGAVYPRLSQGTSHRRANSNNHSNPSDVYRWVKRN